jgi:flagella basal body P-ring formation protein FlgA
MRISEKPDRDSRAPVNSDRPGSPGALSGPASRKLPVPPRERKPALAALALLLVLGGALATTLLVLRSGDRVSAIQITQQIGPGQPILPEAMQEVQIADTGVSYVAWTHRQEVSATFARVTLLPGTLLTAQMVSRASEQLGPGKVTLGLALKAGQMPLSIQRGDHVQVLYVPGSGRGTAQGKVLAPSALVESVGTSEGSSSGLVSIIVDATVSPTIAMYSSSGEIALGKLSGAG